jgi:hypothetical protein
VAGTSSCRGRKHMPTPELASAPGRNRRLPRPEPETAQARTIITGLERIDKHGARGRRGLQLRPEDCWIEISNCNSGFALWNWTSPHGH